MSKDGSKDSEAAQLNGQTIALHVVIFLQFKNIVVFFSQSTQKFI